MPHVVHVGTGSSSTSARAVIRSFRSGRCSACSSSTGYTGYVSSEYEGWHWDTESEAFEMVGRQQALCRQVLEGLGTPVVEGGPRR